MRRAVVQVKEDTFGWSRENRKPCADSWGSQTRRKTSTNLDTNEENQKQKAYTKQWSFLKTIPERACSWLSCSRMM
jgi:hypothetical protein